MEQVVIKIGNSVGLVIPSQLRRELKIRIGEKLIIERVPGKDAIVFRRKGKKSESATSLTLEFYSWLDKINRKYSGLLRELAKH